MRPSRIKAKLARNVPVLFTNFHFCDPMLFEMTSLMGFDGIWVDLEHHSTSEIQAAELMRAARVGTADILARPAKGEFMRMARLLESGAQGIIYPRCDDAAEAQEVVRWAKFAPLGKRGCDASNADAAYRAGTCGVSAEEYLTGYIEAANRETFIAIQIEDPQSLEHVDEIAADEGVDALFFGVGDFSILSGFPGRFAAPEVTAAIEQIARAARRHGKDWGMPCYGPEHATQLLEMGGRLLAHGADIVIMRRALESIQQSFKPLGFTF